MVIDTCFLRAGAELSDNPKGELERVEKLLQFITVLYPDAASLKRHKTLRFNTRPGGPNVLSLYKPTG